MAGSSRSADRSELPATAYAVLGLLSFGRELTGYDLHKWAQNMRFFYWSPAQSQIYTELRRLLSRELVVERVVAREGRHAKKYYRITEQGEKEFRRWSAEAPVEPPIIKHSVMLRLFFGHQGDLPRLRETLREYAGWLRDQRAELETLRATLLPDFPYPELVAAWGQSFYAAEAQAVDDMLEALNKRAGEDPRTRNGT